MGTQKLSREKAFGEKGEQCTVLCVAGGERREELWGGRFNFCVCFCVPNFLATLRPKLRIQWEMVVIEAASIKV